jgi:antitoxin component YwqK of YwqJK toxin-antitoxin module
MNQLNDKNQRHGIWEKYWLNGQLMYRRYYINGKADGYWEYYFDDGTLYYKGKYINDQLIGLWYYYNHPKEFHL